MKSKKLSFLLEYPKFHFEVNHLKDIIFFFPFYHFGGAERVHIDILKVFKENETSCFITEKSINDFFRKEFEENTNIIPYFNIKSRKYEIYYIRAIAKAINRKKSPIVFGCNSPLFYKLIPYLKKNVRIIDLIHAFSYEEPFAAEKISLPVAEKIDKRVVLGQKTKNDFAELYRENNISEELLSRIKIIKNKVEIPDNIPKKDLENLKILFVARNSFEKRPHYVTEIAKKCIEEKLNINFSFVGDFEGNFSDLENVKIIGTVDSYEKMHKIYQEHHLLLITSFREGFPMVILEGMSNEVVPVSTNVGEISQIINPENRNGFLIDDGNLSLYSNNQERISNRFLDYEKEKNTIESFVNVIKSIQQNPDLYNEYSKKSYETVKKYFSAEQQRNAYLKLFFG